MHGEREALGGAPRAGCGPRGARAAERSPDPRVQTRAGRGTPDLAHPGRTFFEDTELTAHQQHRATESAARPPESSGEPARPGHGDPVRPGVGASPAVTRAFVLRVAVATLVVLGLGCAAAVLVAGYDVFLLLFAGVLVAIFLRGIAKRIAAHSPLGLKASLGIVLALLVGLPALAGWLLSPEFAQQFSQLGAQLPAAADRLQAQVEGIAWLQPVLDRLPDTSALAPPRADVLGRITGFFSTTFGALANILIVAVVGAYLALDAPLYRHGFVQLFPPARHSVVRNLLDELGQTLGWWLAAKFASMAVVGVLTWTGLWLLGVSLAVPLALIASLLTFIPNLGPLMAVVPAALLALSQSPSMLLYVVLLYAAVQFVETYLVTPFIQKKMVSLPPVLTLLVQVLAGVLAGGIGIVVAAPLTAVALVLVRRLYLDQVLGEREPRMGPG